MPSHYYIDGYNLIHHCRSLQALAGRQFEAARDAFIEIVARFCVASGKKATIIFDGRGHRSNDVLPTGLPPGLEIIYSPGHLTADTVIERLVYSMKAGTGEVVVVSGDRGIRELCRAMGAMVMAPPNFMATIDETMSRARGELERQDTRHAGLLLEERLSASSLKVLQYVRKELDGK